MRLVFLLVLTLLFGMNVAAQTVIPVPSGTQPDINVDFDSSGIPHISEVSPAGGRSPTDQFANYTCAVGALNALLHPDSTALYFALSNTRRANELNANFENLQLSTDPKYSLLIPPHLEYDPNEGDFGPRTTFDPKNVWIFYAWMGLEAVSASVFQNMDPYHRHLLERRALGLRQTYQDSTYSMNNDNDFQPLAAAGVFEMMKNITAQQVLTALLINSELYNANRVSTLLRDPGIIGASNGAFIHPNLVEGFTAAHYASPHLPTITESGELNGRWATRAAVYQFENGDNLVGEMSVEGFPLIGAMDGFMRALTANPMVTTDTFIVEMETIPQTYIDPSTANINPPFGTPGSTLTFSSRPFTTAINPAPAGGVAPTVTLNSWEIRPGQSPSNTLVVSFAELLAGMPLVRREVALLARRPAYSTSYLEDLIQPFLARLLDDDSMYMDYQDNAYLPFFNEASAFEAADGSWLSKAENHSGEGRSQLQSATNADNTNYALPFQFPGFVELARQLPDTRASSQRAKYLDTDNYIVLNNASAIFQAYEVVSNPAPFRARWPRYVRPELDTYRAFRARNLFDGVINNTFPALRPDVLFAHTSNTFSRPRLLLKMFFEDFLTKFAADPLLAGTPTLADAQMMVSRLAGWPGNHNDGIPELIMAIAVQRIQDARFKYPYTDVAEIVNFTKRDLLTLADVDEAILAISNGRDRGTQASKETMLEIARIMSVTELFYSGTCVPNGRDSYMDAHGVWFQGVKLNGARSVLNAIRAGDYRELSNCRFQLLAESPLDMLIFMDDDPDDPGVTPAAYVRPHGGIASLSSSTVRSIAFASQAASMARLDKADMSGYHRIPLTGPSLSGPTLGSWRFSCH